jgi:hypothetical protein
VLLEYSSLSCANYSYPTYASDHAQKPVFQPTNYFELVAQLAPLLPGQLGENGLLSAIWPQTIEQPAH